MNRFRPVLLPQLPSAPRAWTAWAGISVFTFLGIAALAVAAWYALNSAHDQTTNTSEAMMALLDTGNVLENDILRTVRPAIQRTTMLAQSPDLIASLQSNDKNSQTAVLNAKITSATEIDAIALFNASGAITAINTRYADGKPIAKERLDRVLGADYSQRQIIQSCLRNDSNAPILEFQTHCDITPALFDSTGLSIAYSVPVINPQTHEKLGALSSRMRFDRLSSLIDNQSIAGGAARAYFITDAGAYFSEDINCGKTQPPIPVSELKDIVTRTLGDAASKTITQRADKYLAIFSLPGVQTLEGGGIHILIVADAQWLTRSSEQDRLIRAAGAGLIGALLFIVAIFIHARLASQRAALRLAEVHESNQRLQCHQEMIFNSISEGIHSIDLQGRIVFENPAAARMLGWPASEMLGRDAHMTIHHSHADGAPFPDSDCPIIDALLTGSSRRVRGEVFWRTDQTCFPVDYTVTPVRDDGGQILGAVVVFSDVTESRRHEEELRAARDTAEAATIAKSEFLANMSHELRTPLTAILGYTELLAEIRNSADQDTQHIETQRQEYIDTIKRNGEHLLIVINDILDLSKIEAGKMNVEHIPVNPEQLLLDVDSLMQVRAKAKGITLRTALNTPFPQTIQTDPVRFKQILVNLVGNAIKFTEIGEVLLQIGLTKSTDGRDLLRVEVADTGIGMTPRQTESIFGAFVQADASVTRKFGGTGLGLRISRSLAQILGGDITVNSQPGQGSVFSVTIATGPIDGVPLVQELSATKALRNEAEPKLNDQPSKPLTGMRILLAEDGIDNQRLIAHHLRKAGAQVLVFDNGKLALEAMTLQGDINNPLTEERVCDIVLTDMQMPEMDGYTLAGELRKKGWNRRIIAITAHAMTGDREKCIAAGCDGFVSKPIDRFKVIEICRSAMAA
jgi:PAS domain S-box-containing protein